VQLSPHFVGSSSLAQVVPHLWYPALQATSHFSPSQIGWPLAPGLGQGVQDGPQEPGFFGSTQVPLHAILPAGQPPWHGFASGMQASKHGLVPVGQETPQRTPSQVAMPPWIPGQG
jgi:hypothetical protein